MEEFSEEKLQVYMYDMAQLRDVMKSIGFQEVAVEAQKSYDVAHQYYLYLKKMEESMPGWMRWLMSKRNVP